jgi:hypothetical protein
MPLVSVPRISRGLLAALAVAALALLIGLAGSAGAATKHGITPLSPNAGATVPRGRSPIFRMRKKGPGQLWVQVCRSPKKDAEGTICADEDIGRARLAKNGVWEFKPKFHDFPSFWLNTPGVYYWQAHRISCTASDCRQEGPIVRFRVG